jgi:hypothetical protein
MRLKVLRSARSTTITDGRPPADCSHDTTIDAEDRLAGLSLLLYAQGPSTSSQDHHHR